MKLFGQMKYKLKSDDDNDDDKIAFATILQYLYTNTNRSNIL